MPGAPHTEILKAMELERSECAALVAAPMATRYSSSSAAYLARHCHVSAFAAEFSYAC